MRHAFGLDIKRRILRQQVWRNPQNGAAQEMLAAVSPGVVRRAHRRHARLPQINRPIRAKDQLVGEVILERSREVDDFVLIAAEVRAAQPADFAGPVRRVEH